MCWSATFGSSRTLVLALTLVDYRYGLLTSCPLVLLAFAQPRVKEVFATSAAEQGTMTPGQLRDYMQSEVKAWGDIVRAVGLKVD